MKLDKQFVQRWSNAYVDGMGSVEPHLLSTVGPAAAARGHYLPAELAAVAAWKTSRSKSSIARNSPNDVVDITAAAFSAAGTVQHRVLTLLHGVAVPTASALLAVAFPAAHTVIDVRSTEALRRLGLWTGGTTEYLPYLAVCRAAAKRLRVDLRTLDRALWKWSKAGYP